MVVKDKNIEKMYSSYVSEFHLEMILIPFINGKIEEKENIIIETEYDMNDTLKTLLSKLNLKEENKEKILKLGWSKGNEKNIENNDNIIIIGNKEYIEDTKRKIMQKNVENLTIIDCYKFEDICNNITELASNYNGNLNTNGIQK